MRVLFLGFFVSLAFLCVVCINPTNIYSTNNAQIKMTLALSIATSTGSNDVAQSTVDLKNNTVSFSMKVRDFKFDNFIVENSFEESYLEAANYPQASFQGKLKTPINMNTKTVQKIDVSGDLMMHGVKKSRIISADITVLSNNEIKVASTFWVKASDHKIDISPSMFASGRDEIKVLLSAKYKKQ